MCSWQKKVFCLRNVENDLGAGRVLAESMVLDNVVGRAVLGAVEAWAPCGTHP